MVVFEGGEGAGKSTQVRALAAWLTGWGHECVTTREPGATDLGQGIRELLLRPRTDAPSPRAEALLYAADRAHHVATVIRPALDRGAVVVSDRYVDSTRAYQGAGRALEPADVEWLAAYATAGTRPDLVVVLDIDPAVGLLRAGSRGAADRLEAESLGFHQRIRQAFLDMAAADPGRYAVLDATQPREVLASRVRERVSAVLQQRLIDAPTIAVANG